MRKRRICLLLVAKLAPFGFWSGHGTRASGKIFAIIRSVHPWKLPHLASASLLTAASEVLSISSSSPAPSALSDVRLYHTALGDTIAKHAWSLCPYQSALMLQRSGVGDPSCVALPLLAVLLAPLLAAQRERDSHPRSGKNILFACSNEPRWATYSPSQLRCAPAVVNFSARRACQVDKENGGDNERVGDMRAVAAQRKIFGLERVLEEAGTSFNA